MLISESVIILSVESAAFCAEILLKYEKEKHLSIYSSLHIHIKSLPTLSAVLLLSSAFIYHQRLQLQI